MLTVSLRAERILFKWKEFVFSDVRETFFFFLKQLLSEFTMTRKRVNKIHSTAF